MRLIVRLAITFATVLWLIGLLDRMGEDAPAGALMKYLAVSLAMVFVTILTPSGENAARKALSWVKTKTPGR